jgi:type IV pilus assembly protein PilY1
MMSTPLKDAFKACYAALALASLLCGLTAQATDVAELPLKTSVQAKPNVVFAMDESGSMDAEVMIDGTFQGWFYGAYNSTTTLNKADGTRRDGSGNYEWSLFYLFPNGTGAGNRVYGDPDVSYGYAIPPTPELAWTRSPTFNTLYYDTTRTYKPWSPAYVNGASTSFGAASSAAAKSHPANGASTMALASNLTNNASDARFTFTIGMTVPAGATDVACLWANFQNVLPYTVKQDRGMCKATITYYPATFWNRENCAIDGSNCVAAWDGRTLKRYEIKAGNSFPSGRSYADELQNFANWFTYHRKRRLMLASAMGQVMENISGMRLGVVPFNANAAPTMYDADAASAAANRLAVSGIFYKAEGDGGTPTHATMAYIRDQFNTNTNIVQYACQRNAQFIITDGFANDSAVSPPAYTAATYGGLRPYTTTTGGSLADKALAYFTLQLRASGGTALAAGRVPPGRSDVVNPDTNTNLHLQTYALTLGMKGTVWPTTVDPFTTPPTWPTPVSNTASMIDDLWHATINGRGQMYLASDGAAAAAGITSALGDILSQVGAQGGLAVSSINLDRGDSQAYLATYNPAGWSGDLTANAISRSTAEVSGTAAWSASSLLAARDWTGRVIASYSGGSGVGFTSANVAATVNPSAVYGSDDAVINYLRGSRSGEGSTLRTRTGLLGAVINAEPVLSRDDKIVYLASGEGMLHAFDTDNGKEHWAFVPRAVLPNIGATTARDYSFRTRLDATPTLGKTSDGKRLLVGALGGAGRSYYALDVSSPRDMTEAQLAAAVKWDFPAASDTTNQARMGYSYGRPVVAKTSSQGDVVLVSSGYDNTSVVGDGLGRMWMLKASDGTVLRTFATTAGAVYPGAEAGLTHLSAFRESDGTVRWVYGGDLLGNLWRFDLNTGDVFKLAVLKDSAGNAQPITAPPELVTIAGNKVVLVGTGRLLDTTDFGSSRTQSFYAITDGAYLSNARGGLIARTYTRGASPELSGTAVDWASNRGWYFDLPAGEQANTAPAIAYGAVTFTTNKNGATDCSQSAYLYLVDIGTGLKLTTSDFASLVISTTANASRLTTLRVINGQLIGTSHTSDNSVFRRTLATSPHIAAAKNSWKEIRR